MPFRQTDAASLIKHFETVSDEEGVPWLRAMIEHGGWGPNTRWDDGSQMSMGEIYNLLALTMQRPTSLFFDTLKAAVPVVDLSEEWRAALRDCRVSYEWKKTSDTEPLCEETASKSALEHAWSSPGAWAVVPVARIKQQLGESYTQVRPWNEQIAKASEQLGVAQRRAADRHEGAEWRPYWDALKDLAPLMGVQWPGDPEEWVCKGFDTWLKGGLSSWDQVAVSLNTPSMLEVSWREGVGHEPVPAGTPAAALSQAAQDQLGKLFDHALKQGHPRVIEWMMRETPVLDLSARHAPLGLHTLPTWREALKVSNLPEGLKYNEQKAIALGTALLRGLAQHDPLPEPTASDRARRRSRRPS